MRPLRGRTMEYNILATNMRPLAGSDIGIQYFGYKYATPSGVGQWNTIFWLQICDPCGVNLIIRYFDHAR